MWANQLKSPRTKALVTGQQDAEVFASIQEFCEHHSITVTQGQLALVELPDEPSTGACAEFLG